MQITSNSFEHMDPIPERHAFARPHPEDRFQFSDNVNPHLAFHDIPGEARSLVLVCVDGDVPTVGDDVNQEDRTVPADLPRCDFYHWVMVDIHPDTSEIVEGAYSDGVVAGGKSDPTGPDGSRHGINDFTGWFSGHEQMGGEYRGYDGPAPPWNDELMHHYRFRLYALNIDRCPVDSDFTGYDVVDSIKDHVIAEAEIVGTYTQNPDLL